MSKHVRNGIDAVKKEAASGDLIEINTDSQFAGPATLASVIAPDIAKMTDGTLRFTINGVGPFTVYYDQSGAMGDDNLPVAGDVTGEYEVVFDGNVIFRQHVSPHGTSGYGNVHAKDHGAAEVALAIAERALRTTKGKVTSAFKVAESEEDGWSYAEEGTDFRDKPVWMIRYNGEIYTRAFTEDEAQSLIERYRAEEEIYPRESMKKGAPFAGYKDFADCVAQHQDKDDPEAYCGKIKHQVEGSIQSGEFDWYQIFAHRRGDEVAGLEWEGQDKAVVKKKAQEFIENAPESPQPGSIISMHIQSLGPHSENGFQERVAANPYSPAANPYSNPTPGTPDDLMDGPPHSDPVQDIPMSTRPRQMPGAEVDEEVIDPALTNQEEVVLSSMGALPLVCASTGREFVAEVTLDLICVCGGSDFDLQKDAMEGDPQFHNRVDLLPEAMELPDNEEFAEQFKTLEEHEAEQEAFLSVQKKEAEAWEGPNPRQFLWTTYDENGLIAGAARGRGRTPWDAYDEAVNNVPEGWSIAPVDLWGASAPHLETAKTASSRPEPWPEGACGEQEDDTFCINNLDHGEEPHHFRSRGWIETKLDGTSDVINEKADKLTASVDDEDGWEKGIQSFRTYDGLREALPTWDKTDGNLFYSITQGPAVLGDKRYIWITTNLHEEILADGEESTLEEAKDRAQTALHDSVDQLSLFAKIVADVRSVNQEVDVSEAISLAKKAMVLQGGKSDLINELAEQYDISKEEVEVEADNDIESDPAIRNQYHIQSINVPTDVQWSNTG